MSKLGIHVQLRAISATTERFLATHCFSFIADSFPVVFQQKSQPQLFSITSSALTPPPPPKKNRTCIKGFPHSWVWRHHRQLTVVWWSNHNNARKGHGGDVAMVTQCRDGGLECPAAVMWQIYDEALLGQERWRPVPGIELWAQGVVPGPGARHPFHLYFLQLREKNTVYPLLDVACLCSQLGYSWDPPVHPSWWAMLQWLGNWA